MAYSAKDLTPAQRKSVSEMLGKGDRTGAAAFVKSAIDSMNANKAQTAQKASGLSAFQQSTQKIQSPGFNSPPATNTGIAGGRKNIPGIPSPTTTRVISGTDNKIPTLNQAPQFSAQVISPAPTNSDEAAMNQANQNYADVVSGIAGQKNESAQETANRLAATIGQQNAAKQGGVDALQSIVDQYSKQSQQNYDTSVAGANELLEATIANQGVQALVAQSGENMRGASEGSKLDVGRTAGQIFDTNAQAARNTRNTTVNSAGSDKLAADYNRITITDKVRQLRDVMTDAQYKVLTDSVTAQGANQKAALDLIEQAYAKSFGAVSDAATSSNVFTFRNNLFENKWNTSDTATKYSMISSSFADNPEGAKAALEAFFKNESIGYSELQAIANAKGGEMKHRNELETAYSSRGEGLGGSLTPSIAASVDAAGKVGTQSPLTKADKANYERVVKNLSNYFKMSRDKKSEYYEVFKSLDGIRKRFNYETKSPAERKAIDDFVKQKLPRLFNS